MAATAKLLYRPLPLFRANFNSNRFRRTLAQCSNRSRKADIKKARAASAALDSVLKRRTRSETEFDGELVRQYVSEGGHIPVMLGEVLEVFSRLTLRSFVDCTVGAAGHSSAVIRAHSELQLYIGLDVDPVAHEKAQAQIDTVMNDDSRSRASDLRAYTLLKNFKDVKSALHEVDRKLLDDGVDGILMDLGVSSMQVNNAKRGFSVLNDGPLDMRMNPQASLKAEDILNSWPEDEVGRILREYGEESNWRSLQTKIVKARLGGGLHSTGELVNLVQSTSGRSGGRQGWIKTATRVFQALRIAVNDELKTLEDALYACFDCLSSGGRLAVISFHSLEDRIVKQTFLDIINKEDGNGDEERFQSPKDSNDSEGEAWSKHRIGGRRGTILTKRPVTPTEEEERLNRRCRSGKLRVIQKT
ncbi:mraW methylase family protein [Tasmannia lanceolata]|uniref:mraW methylase family protein n=1 Tax=Tasmannia lanceolata TaxID=3420 RepID=UPI00406474BB